MYQIYIADLGRAVNNREVGSRPVVVVEESGNLVSLLKITDRMKIDTYHVRMNNYIIHGFCNVHDMYVVDKKCLKTYIRDCTTSEYDLIYSSIKNRV